MKDKKNYISKKSVFFLVLVFLGGSVNAQNTIVFKGKAIIANGDSMSYQLTFPQSNGLVKGKSISGEGQVDETVAEVNVILSKDQKRLTLQEIGVISTKSKSFRSVFSSLKTGIIMLNLFVAAMI